MILDGSYEIWNVYLLFWMLAGARLAPSLSRNGPIFKKYAGSNLLDKWSLLQVTNLDFEEFGNLPRFPNSPLTGLTRLG
jgi:hypothetical protein